MASQDRKNDPDTEGETSFGPRDPNQQVARGLVHIASSNIAGRGSVLAFDAIANTGVCTTYYLFFGSDGKLRESTTEPTNTNTDGTVVGTQT